MDDQRKPTDSGDSPSPSPKVGIGVWIRRDGKVLLGLRESKHGEGTWCPPGGHLEYGESLEQCALREVAEECGVKITTPAFTAVTNDIFTGSAKHYITLHMIADWLSEEARLLEPDKCCQWQWFSPDDLPSPLFLPAENLFKSGVKIIER